VSAEFQKCLFVGSIISSHARRQSVFFRVLNISNLLKIGAAVSALALTGCDTIVDSADYLHNSLIQNVDPQWRGGTGTNYTTVVIVTNVVVVTNMDHSLPR